VIPPLSPLAAGVLLPRLSRWIMPLLAVLLLIAYSAGLIAWGQSAGRAEVQAAWDSQKAEDARLVQRTVNRQSQLVIAAEVAAATRQAQEKATHERILTAARAEIRRSELARVDLGRELERLYRDAARPGDAPAPAAEPGSTPGATCADAVERAIENAGIANRNADRILELQEFYNRQREVLIENPPLR
jgi:hypothetical protein